MAAVWGIPDLGIEIHNNSVHSGDRVPGYRLYQHPAGSIGPFTLEQLFILLENLSGCVNAEVEKDLM